MRQGIRDFVETVSRILPIPEPVYEFGAWQAQPGFSDLRPFFPNKQYYGCDIHPGIGVDKILDIHSTGLPDGSVGTILLLETLEHVQFPVRALSEAHRILKQGGSVILSSPLDYPIHDAHDYWRFMPEGLLTLLEDFQTKIVESAGNESFPATVVGIGFKGDLPGEIKQRLISDLKLWKKSWNLRAEAEGFQASRVRDWKASVKLLTPPILLNLYRKLRHSDSPTPATRA
jgi:SAM-dependent methyltransferase